MDEKPTEVKSDNEKWEFADYAYTITGIIVGVLLVGPELLAALLEALGEIDKGGLGIMFADVADIDFWDWGLFHQLRALSPLLFLLTTTIVYFHEAFEVRKTGEYKGTMFTHTFESLFEEAIYFAITTVMLYGAILFGAMYVSWLAAPISWVLFVFIFPIFGKSENEDDKDETPWLLLAILAAGIVLEVLTGLWIAFPLSWLGICAVKFVSTTRSHDGSIDSVFNILYYAFSVVLMAVGVFLGFWIASWSALLIALFVSWLLHKTGKFSKAEIG